MNRADLRDGAGQELIVTNRQRVYALNRLPLERLARLLLVEGLGYTKFSLGLQLVGPREMTRINQQFLRHAGSTDVITFDHRDGAGGPDLNGEIWICLDEAERQARRYQTSWQLELGRYIVHGLLHLRGYEDRRAQLRQRMKREEDRWVRWLRRRNLLRALGRRRRRLRLE